MKNLFKEDPQLISSKYGVKIEKFAKSNAETDRILALANVEVYSDIKQYFTDLYQRKQKKSVDRK